MLASAALAERFIFVPIGDRITDRQIKFTSYVEGLSFGSRWSSVGFGFGNGFDAEITFENTRMMRTDRMSLDLSYNLVPALPDFGVGVSVGIQDFANVTEKERSFYLALTMRMNNDGLYNSGTPSEFTIGAGTGRYKGLFFSLRVPASDWFRFVAEHDSRRIMGGIEIAPFRDVNFRWLVRDQETILGLTYLYRF